MIAHLVAPFPSFVERGGELRHGFGKSKTGDAFTRLHRQGCVKAKTTHNSSGQFPECVVEAVAARLAVVADPTRIRLLELLNECDATVSEISERLDIAPAEVSQHLAALHAAGFLSRWGSPATYHLIDWTDWWVVEQVGRNLTDPHQADRGDVK